MTALAVRHFVGTLVQVFEHAAFFGIGFVLTIVGLGLGVTMIMLPVGVVVAVIGVLMMVGGLFARLD